MADMPDGETSRSSYLIGDSAAPLPDDRGAIAFDDSKIAFFCRYARDRDVLDLGCVHHNPENYKSRFWLHKALVRVSHACLGVDYYAPGVAYLRERGYDVVAGDAESLNLGRRFDVVTAGDLIEHLDNAGAFLDSVTRHLRPGGRLVLSTPNPWYWRFPVKSLFTRDVRPNPEHVGWYCAATLRTLLARHGMHIVEIRHGSRYLRDQLMPLPRYIKHTTIFVAAEREENGTAGEARA